MDVLKGGSIYLKRAVAERTPLNIYTQNGIDVSIASEFIDSLFRQNRIRAGSSIILLEKPYVMLKTISIPAEEKENADAIIKEQLKDSMPFDLNTVDFDYYLYDSGRNIQGIVGIVKKDIIEDLRKVARKSMILIRSIDIGILSTLNLFVLTVKPERGKTYVVVNSGYSNTDVIITDGWIPLYIRTIDYGLESMIRMVGSYETISINDIESALISSANPQKNRYVLNILADGVQVFVRKIKNAIIDYSAQAGVENLNVESVSIFGGVGYIVGLMAGDGSQLDFSFRVRTPDVFQFVDRTNSRTEKELPFHSIYSATMGSILKELIIGNRISIDRE